MAGGKAPGPHRELSVMLNVSERNHTERSHDEMPGGEPNIIAASPAMLEVLAMARRAAVGESKVLITGESGVGKDLVARTIHVHSTRSHGPFVAVNCAGLTETLLESELFGHVKGSFTGAYRDKPGKLQLAHRGTLFLDEVGEMSLRMQALLLRFLENGEIQAVGADGASGHAERPRHRRDQPQPGRARRRRASSARTCSTGCASSTSTCRRCASGARTSRC